MKYQKGNEDKHDVHLQIFTTLHPRTLSHPPSQELPSETFNTFVILVVLTSHETDWN